MQCLSCDLLNSMFHVRFKQFHPVICDHAKYQLFTSSFQDSSEDDLNGKKKSVPVAFGSRTSVRRSTEPSTSEESKEGDDSESGGDGGLGKEKAAKKKGKEVKTDKEKVKGATMTTPKKVGIMTYFTTFGVNF